MSATSNALNRPNKMESEGLIPVERVEDFPTRSWIVERLVAERCAAPKR